ncbi:hypothetical protein DL762_001809 [Monosporascus cannonballus]|uniref:Uncharacterized protein n=1 Tax=Monosporascus cannonballus TaxID=155416 RepID=A0ABY0HFD9_9PEZI|nr:hypothetical protein DL762_001809 [Monosporascus cannonballus]
MPRIKVTVTIKRPKQPRFGKPCAKEATLTRRGGRSAKAPQSQVLQQYLEVYYSLSFAIRVVADRSLTMQSDTTNPTGRISPGRIIPWDNFAIRQEKIWDQFLIGLINPIISQIGQHFELADKTYGDLSLRASLGFRGFITFENHMNLGNTVDAVSESFEHMSIGGDDGVKVTTPAPRQSGLVVRYQTERGKGKLADQFYKTSDIRNISALAIEDKTPHKLTRDEIISGLASKPQPECDVINKDSEDFMLAAAVISQRFYDQIFRSLLHGRIDEALVLFRIFMHYLTSARPFGHGLAAEVLWC